MYTLYLFTENDYLKKLYDEKARENNENNSGNAGFDLYVPYKMVVGHPSHSDVIFLDHEVICRMAYKCDNDENECSVSYYLYPRSSMSKTPFRLANSVGVIDSGYRGNIIAALDYIREYDYALDAGQRLVQICAPTLESFRVVVCDSKDDARMDINTNRSSGGFGSSGK